MQSSKTRFPASTLAAVAMAIGLGACAGSPPVAQMAVSRTAISDAQAAGAGQYAPLALRSAQDSLARAQYAVSEKEYDEARRHAEKAAVDAKLAETHARSVKARQAAREIRASIAALRE